MPDWLVIAQEEWDQVERRNQLLIRALAERHPGTRFLFAEIPLRPREALRWRLPRPRKVGPNIWTFRAIRPFPGALQRASDAMESIQLRRAARALSLAWPLLWTQDPRAANLVDRLPVGRIVYDLTDDWAAFEADPARRARTQDRIEWLGRRADVVFACSRALERGARAWSEHVHFLPNAVDPPDDAATTPATLGGLPRPRVGYVGTLHSSRLDIDLVAGAAELRESWSFVLLGPDQLEPSDRERLAGLPNVHHLGVVPHAEVRSYLEALDVGLLPHRITDFTRSLDPLKVYEYLAAGLPVVASPVGNAPELDSYMAVASTPDQLVAEVERELAEDNAERASTRRAAVAGATWEARARDIEAVLGMRSEPPGRADVCAVIVSYNTRDLLERCLKALHTEQGDVGLRVIVVDNGSSDGSVELVRERFPDVELMPLNENVGFARANNMAFERCRGDYVLLLNSDAFLAPGALAELVAAARRNPRAGAVGPRLHNPDGTLQRSAWPFPHARRLALEAFGLHRPLRRLGLMEDLGTWGHDEERSVDFLIGACLLLRADALAEVGAFDERFWLYGEEADLQRRLADRGWGVVFAPAAIATHVGAASSLDSAERLRHFYTGQMRFLTKHGNRISWPLARVALLIGSLVRGRWRAARVALGLRRYRPG
jgi:GT2 family glycosyltransferase/glycosyltransferase involved in cell wall biosynthesis